MTIIAASRGAESRTITLLTSVVKRELLSKDTALFEIPACYIEIFDLSGIVIEGKELERRKRHAEEWNAVKLRPTKEDRPEIVGGIRIN